MFKEVAFDPCNMSEIEYYSLLKQSFGFDQGRCVSAEIRAWAKEAMGYVKDAGLQPVKEKSIKNYLNKLVKNRNSSEFFLAQDRRSIEAEKWDDWWEAQKAIREFSLTVSRLKGDGCFTIDNINDGCDEWTVPPSISVDRTAVDIVDALMSLAVVSNGITIVDPYFRLSKNATLDIMFRRLSATTVKSIRVISSVGAVNASQIYVREYKKLNAANIAFEYIQAPTGFFHDRYFITEVGAVRSGHGFMPAPKQGVHADMANINLVSELEAKRTLSNVEQLLESGRASVLFSV